MSRKKSGRQKETESSQPLFSISSSSPAIVPRFQSTASSSHRPRPAAIHHNQYLRLLHLVATSFAFQLSPYPSLPSSQSGRSSLRSVSRYSPGARGAGAAAAAMRSATWQSRMLPPAADADLPWGNSYNICNLKMRTNDM